MILNTEKFDSIAFVWEHMQQDCPFIVLEGSLETEFQIDKLVYTFKSYAIIERDFNIAKKAFTKIIKFDEDDRELIPTFLDSAVISYGRPFGESKGRNVTLDANAVFKNRNDLMDIHKSLIDLRHKFIAHTDKNQYEKILLYIALAPLNQKKEVIELYRGLVRTVGFDKNFYSASIEAINFSLDWIKIKMDGLYSKILSEIKNIEIADLYQQAHLPENLNSNTHKVKLNTKF